jgi:hypothetical protein
MKRTTEVILGIEKYITDSLSNIRQGQWNLCWSSYISVTRMYDQGYSPKTKPIRVILMLVGGRMRYTMLR